jgi:hypothetical protein
MLSKTTNNNNNHRVIQIDSIVFEAECDATV